MNAMMSPGASSATALPEQPAIPAVSCLMPVYNGEKYLERAVRSILEQTFTDFEFIIVDDGSRDATGSILARLASTDPRLTVLTKPNGGIVDALNFGLSKCRGRYVARMDADDIALPHRFAFQVAYLDRTPGCAIVGGNVVEIDAHDRPVRTDRPRLHLRTSLDVFPVRVATANHPLAMIRRDVLTAIGGYRSTFPHAEDYDLFLRVARFGTIDNPDEPLLLYRKHEASISVRHLVAQERNAAYAELSAILVHRGLPDPAEQPDLDEANLHRQLQRAVPDWLFAPYVEFRIWRRLRSLDRTQARRYYWRVLAAALAPAPRTLLSSAYWQLRVRILGRMLLNARDGFKGALRGA